MPIRVLTENQTMVYNYQAPGGFEQNYPPSMSQHLMRLFDSAFGTRTCDFLDVGGGCGMLADHLLSRFANWQGVVFDVSPSILATNVKHARKVLREGSALNLTDHFVPGSFDLILMHNFLHHIVTGRYGSSGKSMMQVLSQARMLLRPGGHLSIIEQCYNGWIDWAPSRIIFSLTSTRLLSPLARRLGANTAGVGVRFLSMRQWQRVLSVCGIRIAGVQSLDRLGFSRMKTTLMCLRQAHGIHYWCDTAYPQSTIDHGPSL